MSAGAEPSPPTATRPSSVKPVGLGQVCTLLAESLADDTGVELTGVTHDSRRVLPGDLYAALPGANVHGARFVEQATAAGAVAVLTDPVGAGMLEAADGLPVLVVPEPRAVLGAVASLVYGAPASALVMLGVTGTNGKTTVAHLVHDVLQGTGVTAGLLGTVEARVGNRRIPSVRTTPEAPDLQALLAVMVEGGARACVMEVSSHALVLGRVDGIVFDVVGFTNLSQDHLDFHGDLERYFAAKADLFTPQRSRQAVVVVEDDWGRRLLARAGVPVTPVLPVGDPAHGDDAARGWRVRSVRHGSTGSQVAVRTPGGRDVDLAIPLPGEFNVLNGVLATAMAVAGGVGLSEAVASLAQATGVPGRMERVVLHGPPGPAAADAPTVVVDYAHTPDAIARVLASLRGQAAGRLAVVLGAGGDRDRGKRSEMGGAAVRGADIVVVTDDNPRSEPPADIRAAVLEGTHGAAADVVVHEVADRAAAIGAAIMQTGAGDVVLVAGKGHEQGQEVAGVVHPFDDRSVARDWLRLRAQGPR